MGMSISSDFSYSPHHVEIDGARMHYIKEGKGDPIVFLHGMPTSSYVWRNIIPHLANLGCCIAPDLIGMGKSDKPDIDYSLSDHIYYIEHFINKLNLNKVTLIMHGWGSVIGLDWAMRHPNKCKALVFYESYLCPINQADISLPMNEQIYELEQQENVYDLVKDGTYYIDKVLSQEMMRALSNTELERYREPFLKKGSGKPLRQYLKELPLRDQNSNTNKLIANYSKKLTKSTLPKLLLYSVPGFITTIGMVIWAKEHLPNLEIIDIGEELHYAQESNPIVMGKSISVWLQSLDCLHGKFK